MITIQQRSIRTTMVVEWEERRFGGAKEEGMLHELHGYTSREDG
jgi:hypothetical protein